ncbi:MAG: carboxypeptidase-like regulatory domain-containing protein, partial [Acidimicrobiia bacterium]
MSTIRLLWRALGVTALLFVTAPGAFAQLTESRIVGKVSDATGASLPGVTVTATAEQTGVTRTAVTEGAGNYAVTNLAPGRYLVKFTLDGFSPVEQRVALGVGDNKTIHVNLAVATLTEEINVSAEAPVLDLGTAKIGVNVSPEEVQSLPVNGRNFANLMALATGASNDGNGGWTNFRFNGKSNEQNYLNYDGVDGTYVWDANPGYISATGSQFRLQTSMESVAEFRVNSGLAPAESGLGTGGNITVVTKSG